MTDETRSNPIVLIDGETWEPSNSETVQYDAIHCIAGAILAGADTVEYKRIK